MVNAPIVLYGRVSTTHQGADGYGVGAQLEECRRFVKSREIEGELLEVIDVCSGAVDPDERDGLGPALQRLDYDGGVLVVTKLDRLARSVIGAATLWERAQQRGWALVFTDNSGLDTTTPYGEAMAGMQAVWAQLERRLISARTTEAMAEARRRGVRLGPPVTTPQESRDRVMELWNAGKGLKPIARQMNEEGWPTAKGGRWHPSTIRSLIRSHRLDQAAKKAAALHMANGST